MHNIADWVPNYIIIVHNNSVVSVSRLDGKRETVYGTMCGVYHIVMGCRGRDGDGEIEGGRRAIINERID